MVRRLAQLIADLVGPARRRSARHPEARAGGDRPGPGGPPADRAACAAAAASGWTCASAIWSDRNPEPVYVGRLGLTDAAGDGSCVDWRSPAAEPFFGATHANPMGLAAAAGTAGPADGSATTGTRCSPRTGSKRTPRSTTSPPSSPAWAAAGRPGCATCSAPSRRTRTPSSAQDRAELSSSTAVRAPEDRRRAAPHRLPALLRPSPRPPPGSACSSSDRTGPPGLRRRRPAQPRRGGRADLHPARPRRRGSHRSRRDPTRRWPA